MENDGSDGNDDDYLSTLLDSVDENELKSYHAKTTARMNNNNNNNNTSFGKKKKKQKLGRGGGGSSNSNSNSLSTEGIISKLEKQRWTVERESSDEFGTDDSSRQKGRRRRRSRSLER